jgi:NADH-quinone oxidoreductase subunit M
MGLAQTAVLGALIAQDLALFVVFFDLMLVPFFFLTGQWGSGDRVRATTKLVIYTLVGSLLMLAAAVALGVLSAGGDQSLTFEISALAERTLPKGTQEWIFLFFAAAFLVKMPAFPLHGWMPDGYLSMPLPVLAVFSGVLSKVAAYGFLRICLPVLPDASAHYQEFMLVIALLSILYGSVMAFTTTNARLVLGYSSVAQLGFIVLGIFALRDASTQGSILQAVNHGLIVVPAFFVVALLAERVGSEDLRDMGGLALRAPVLAAMALIVTFGVLAMPGSSNFIGEFMILLGAFESKIVFAIVASTGVVLAAVYALRLFILAFHNNRGDERPESREISFRDGLVLVPLVAAVIALSLYPQVALHRSERSATQSVAAAKAIASGEAAATREVTP